MKRILLLLILTLSLFAVKAQWVTIPDQFFADYLDHIYPSCMNGNQLDTNCAALDNRTFLDMANLQYQNHLIANLDGVQYFKQLKQLWCFNNRNIFSIPALPPNLVEFWCTNDSLLSLPRLPDSLQSLECYQNHITHIPDLPAGLQMLAVDMNPIDSLPLLPLNLSSLSCEACNLTSLPVLPPILEILYCNNNNLTSLPSLPQTIHYLHCQNNDLTSIPTLPNTLFYFDCSYNRNLACLPSIPLQVRDIKFDSTTITCLPNYPDFYSHQVASFPGLSSLPLCDELNNHGCSIAWNIAGTIYVDSNFNCENDTFDIKQSGVVIELLENGVVEKRAIAINNGNYSFTVSHWGSYTVKLSDTSNYHVVCPDTGHYDVVISQNDSTSKSINFSIDSAFIFLNLSTRSLSPQFTIFPNPTSNQLNITINENLLGSSFTIYDMNGKTISSTQLNILNSIVEVENIAPGIYLAEIKSKQLAQRVKWVKM